MVIIIALLILILLAIIAPNLLKTLFFLPIALALLTWLLNGAVAKPFNYAIGIITALYILAAIGTVVEKIKNAD